jgi:hypothetical protein
MITILDLLSCFVFGGLNLGHLRLRQYAKGIVIAVAVFLVAGTLVGVWHNPFFTRATSISGYGIPLLIAQSLTVGLFFSLEREFRATSATGIGTALALAGIACPLCNRIVDAAIGVNVLAAHGDFLCTLLGAAGVGLSVLALIWRSAQLTFSQIATDELFMS